MLEHEADEGDEVEVGEGAGVLLVVLDEAAEARGPGEGALDDRAAWQQDEASRGFGQFDDLEFDAVLASGVGGVLAGVARIDIGQVDAPAGF